MFPGGMEYGEEEVEAAARVIRSRNPFRYYGVGEGPHEVADFEREFAAHLGAKHALMVNAGSSALICGLIGAGVRPGDEVIVPAYTWNATPNAVVATGAIPVLADVDDSLTLDPLDVERQADGADARNPARAHARRPGRHGAPRRDRTERGLASSRTSARRRVRRIAASDSAPSATPVPSACSSTRSSPPARAA